MRAPREKPGASDERAVLVALAVCCAVPMLVIIVLTSVMGVALGPAVALSMGLVAAGVCVAVMVQHHRGDQHNEGHHRGS